MCFILQTFNYLKHSAQSPLVWKIEIWLYLLESAGCQKRTQNGSYSEEMYVVFMYCKAQRHDMYM